MSSLSDAMLEQLRDLAREVCHRQSCELYDLEFLDAKSRILRIFILSPEGISLDKCEKVSRGLSLLLDNQDSDIIAGDRYDLEVSSPGVERRLKERWHFQGAVNEVVKVHLTHPITIREQGREQGKKVKHFSGVLVQVQGDQVVVDLGSSSLEVSLNQIRKAHVVFNFNEKNLKI